VTATGGAPTIVQAGLSLHGHLRTEQFLLHNAWGLHLYFYAGKLSLKGEVFPFSSGTVSITPPNVPLEWEFPYHAPHYYIHFTPSYKSGEVADSISFNFPIISAPLYPLEEFVRDMEVIGQSYQSEQLKSRVRLWNLLWKISEATEVGEQIDETLPSAVQIAISYINQHYASPLVISELANHSGVSHNYLILLFKKHLNSTIQAYIRKRRVEQAQFLLRNSSLSIKSIAQAVGIPNLNHFNKTIRSELGASPTKVRQNNSLTF
jgi:AraC family transcriptional regulator